MDGVQNLFIGVGKVHKGIDDVMAFKMSRVGSYFADILSGNPLPKFLVKKVKCSGSNVGGIGVHKGILVINFIKLGRNYQFIIILSM